MKLPWPAFESYSLRLSAPILNLPLHPVLKIFSCITGFSGDRCETAKDMCNVTNPCEVGNNTVSCYTGVNDANDTLIAKCQCNNGFTGPT